ncbi:hypothetical protein NIES4103_26560 [Nostoc sp. NIES-4103]|nr:hypothetical protein NIES4103_26560 [Nostoc sp. NIES-4103]
MFPSKKPLVMLDANKDILTSVRVKKILSNHPPGDARKLANATLTPVPHLATSPSGSAVPQTLVRLWRLPLGEDSRFAALTPGTAPVGGCLTKTGTGLTEAQRSQSYESLRDILRQF